MPNFAKKKDKKSLKVLLLFFSLVILFVTYAVLFA